MSYADKINEHKMIIEKCKDMKAFNIGASRAYYCAFLTAKSILIANHFNYDGFLKQIKSKDRVYSHGTIQRAVIEYLTQTGKSKNEICKLMYWDNLYRRRLKADYKEDNILEIEFNEIMNNLEQILSIF